MTTEPRTVGDAIRHRLRTSRTIAEDIEAALGLDPSTLIANVVVLGPGQHVVDTSDFVLRLVGKATALDEMATKEDGPERARLRGKAEGVRLAAEDMAALVKSAVPHE